MPMARLARVVAADTPHHVTQRGNARREVFYTDNDRLVYLSLLQHHSKVARLEILGYCLMSNHVHLITVPRAPDALARALHHTHGRYAIYLNSRTAATGHVWQGRYYSCPMDENHTWTALRYTECNPVRAGMVQSPSDWPWSSAQAHTGLRPSDPLISLDEWSDRWNSDEWEQFLATASHREAAEIRACTSNGRPLGSAEFIAGLEETLHRQLHPNKGGRPKKRSAGEQLNLVNVGSVPGFV
jgi:putative transposase